MATSHENGPGLTAGGTYAPGGRVLLLAPVSEHGTELYRLSLETLTRIHPDAEVIADSGLWNGKDDWLYNWRRTLREIDPTDLYLYMGAGGRVGRGIYEMWEFLEFRGTISRAATAAIPNLSEPDTFDLIRVPNFGLRIADSENWRQYAEPYGRTAYEAAS